MEIEIKSYILRFSGQVELNEPLEISTSYNIVLDGEVRKSEDATNDDGTINRTYKFAPIKGQIVGVNGKVSQTKDARSQSKKIRAVIRHQFMEDKDTKLDEEQYYQQKTAKIIKMLIDGKL